MKKLNTITISAAIILGISITSCENLEAKYCTKDCKIDKSKTNVVQENDGIKIFESTTMKNDSLKFDFSSEESLVCLLTGAEQAERKEILQKEIFSQVKKVEEIESGFIFYFEYEEIFLIKMMDYIIAENNCCPFFTFETKLHSKDDVSLKITGSKQAKEMIKMTLVDKI